MSENALLQRLHEIQRFLGSTDDREFAARLGITHSYWVMLRNGKRKPGHKLFVGVIKAFPELEKDALSYLRKL